MKLKIWYTKICIFYYVCLCFCNSVLIDNLEQFSVNDEMKYCTTKVMARAKINRPLTIAMMAVDDVVAVQFYKIENNTFISRGQNWDSYTLPFDVYIVMSKDIDDLKKKIDMLRNDYYWNPRQKFVLIFEHSFFKNEATTFLRKYNIVNVVIIVKGSKGRHEIYGFGLDLDFCNKPLQIEFIGYCLKVEKNKIFPVRIPGKLDKCHITFMTHTFLPYTGTFRTGNIGVEDYVIDMIHKALGITFDLVNHKTNEDFRSLLSNGSFSGLLQSVSMYDTEGTIGGLQIRLERIAYFDFTYPYEISHVKVVVATTDFMGSWKAVLRQLSFVTLFLIFLCFVVFSIATTLLMIFPTFPNKKRDLLRNFLIVWGYFLNCSSVNNVNTNLSPRIIVIDVLFFTILLNCIIQALLSSATMKPLRDHQPTDISEVMESYYPAIHKSVKFSKPSVICNTVYECITKVRDSKGTSRALYARAPEINFNFLKWQFLDNLGHFQIHDLRESIGLEWQSICFVKGSTVLPDIQNVLNNIISSHLISHYLKILEHSLSLKYLYSDSQETLKRHDIHDFGDSFVILTGGLSLSLLAFIIEVVTYKFMKRSSKTMLLNKRGDVLT